MHTLFLILPASLFCSSLTSARPLDNTTSSLVFSTTDHGNPNLHCKHASFTDFAVFYLANYLAHCATVKMRPGENAQSSFASIVMALFFPTSGVIRAVSAIIRHARITRKDELRVALRAGALCMVVRSRHWKPEDGDMIRDCRTTTSQKTVGSGTWRYEFITDGLEAIQLKNRSSLQQQTFCTGDGTLASMQDATGPPKSPVEGTNSTTKPTTENAVPMSVWNPHWMAELLPVMPSQRIYPRYSKIHGIMTIPEGYRLQHVPSDAEIVSLAPANRSAVQPARQYGQNVVISNSYSIPKAIIAIMQTIYAATTLFHTRGNQIQVFGYAAFGLTVTPYIVMSIVNLIAQIATPDYNALFLVRSDIMDEAEKRGGVFDGVVGKLVHDEISNPDPRSVSGIVSKPKVDGFYEIMTFQSSNRYDVPSNQENLLPSDARDGQSQTFFPFRPQQSKHKNEASKYHEWLYVPCCTPFRRSCAVTDGTVHPPTDSRPYLSKRLDDDKADKGYSGVWSDILERKYRSFYVFWIPIGISFISVIVNGALSGFIAWESTKAQRGWIMSWLILGIVLAPMYHFFGQVYFDFLCESWIEKREISESVIPAIGDAFLGCIVMAAMLGVFFAPAIGGLVVVGEMIGQYGTCISLN